MEKWSIASVVPWTEWCSKLNKVDCSLQDNTSGAVRQDIELTGELERALRNVSVPHHDFVVHALSHPAFLERTNFAALDEYDPAVYDAIQSWPTLVDAASRQELEKVSVGLCRLIKSIPRAVFDYDPELISAFYHLDLDFIKYFVLGISPERSISAAVGRGDFIKGPQGLWCIEFNIASNLGGMWEARAWQRKVTRIPLISNYIHKKGMSARVVDSFKLMMCHFVKEWLRSRPSWRGAINAACVLQKSRIDLDERDRVMGEALASNYRELLAEISGGSEGELLICAFDDLIVTDGPIFLHGRPVHMVVEFVGGDVPLHLLRCQQLNRVTIHNGPITYLLCNKLNFALLSELQDSDLFTEEDQELIRCHIPWTRKMETCESEFRRQKIVLPGFVHENQQGLVLKKSISRSGHDVVLGPCVTGPEWTIAITRAFEEQDWIVQEYVPCPPLLYQHGENGASLHDVVWGLFVFGDTYGGSFLRMLPKARKSAISAALGSTDGIVLEIS